MASVTVTEAAKLTGVTRKTLYAHIKNGKLSKSAGSKLDTSELLRVYGAFVDRVTPKLSPKETPSDTMVTLTKDQLETIIKEAVKAALIEAMPLLLEHREAAPAMPTPIAEPVELMRDGTPFKKLDFDDIPSMGGILK